MLTISNILLAAAVWFVLSAVWRFDRRFRPREDAGKSGTIQNALPGLGVSLGAVLVGFGIWYAASLSFTGRLLFAIRWLALAMVAAGVIDIASLLLSGERRVPGVIRRASGVVALMVGIGVAGGALFLKSVPGPNDEALVIQPPVQGQWRVVAGGRTRLTNYHHNRPPAQSYAIDIQRRGGPSEGQPVFAPLDGEVIVAIGDRWEGDPEPDGNIVGIRAARDVEVWLAHLERESVSVEVGDRVQAGQLIGRCGATGSATEPHVHLHAERNGEPVPMVIGEERHFPVRNDVIGG